jgi:uracil DNA glycosylase
MTDFLSLSWEDFTDAVVRELGKKEGLVYLLWGKPAQAK